MSKVVGDTHTDPQRNLPEVKVPLNMAQEAAASEVQKRKSSLDDARPDDEAKRHKGDDHCDVGMPESHDDEENEEDEEDEEHGSAAESDEDGARPTPNLDGPGPFVFICYADAIPDLLSGGDDQAPFFLLLKSSVVEAWGKVVHLPKEEERSEAIDEYFDMVKKWFMNVEEDAHKSPDARLLAEAWWNMPARQRKAGGGKASSEDEDWWYEVRAQREKPRDGEAAMEVELQDVGRWWITGFAATDRDCHDAMSVFGHNLYDWVDPV